MKADLEDKVGALTDEINFLKTIYDEVTNITSISIQISAHLFCNSDFCWASCLQIKEAVEKVTTFLRII